MPNTHALARGILLVVLLGAGCAGKEELVHGLDEFEANEIKSVLEQKGIKAHKEKEEGGRTVTYKIIVGGGDALNGLKILVDNQLPRKKPVGLMNVYDPANRPLIPTATQEEAEFIMALQGEVMRKLLVLPGVVDTHVTIQKPKRDVVREINEKAAPATASVVIIYNLVSGKMPFKVEDVQRIVAATVEGMLPENVQVLATLNQPAVTTVSVVSPGGEEEGVVAPTASIRATGGVNVVSEADKKRLNTMLMVAGILVGVLLIAFIVLLAGLAKAKTAAKTASANLEKLRKTRAEPPPPAA